MSANFSPSDLVMFELRFSRYKSHDVKRQKNSSDQSRILMHNNERAAVREIQFSSVEIIIAS